MEDVWAEITSWPFDIGAHLTLVVNSKSQLPTMYFSVHANLSVIGGKLISYDNEDEKLPTVGRGGCLNNTRGTQKKQKDVDQWPYISIYGNDHIWRYMVLTNDHIYVDDDKGGPQTWYVYAWLCVYPGVFLFFSTCVFVFWHSSAQCTSPTTYSSNVTSVCICPPRPNLLCVRKSSQTPQSESPLCVCALVNGGWARRPRPVCIFALTCPFNSLLYNHLSALLLVPHKIANIWWRKLHQF